MNMTIDTSKIFQSKLFKGVFFGVLAFIVLLLAFKAGTMVGFIKADFSCRWSDNYQKNFGGPKGGFPMGFGDRDFLEANGTFGKIMKISTSTLIIKGAGDVEKVILIDDGTVIKNLKETVKPSDLKVDDAVVIIGEPNDAGQIKAKLIRIMPSLPKPPPERDVFPNHR